MKVKFQARNRTRFKKRFMGITTFEIGMWFNYNTNRWEKNPKAGEKGFSSHQDCKSVKAFKRKLKKAPKGVEFILTNRYVGYDVYGIGCK